MEKVTMSDQSSETAYFYHLQSSIDESIAAIERIHQAHPLEYLYAEEAANLHLAYYRRPELQWTHGRAFNALLEVRWNRRGDGKVDLLILSERPFSNQDNWQPVTLGSSPSTMGEPVVEPGQVVLLGVSRRHKDSPYGDDPEAPKLWTDSRAQRSIEYPLSDRESRRRWAKVKIKTYWVNGCPLASRMMSLEGIDHAKPL